MNLNTLFQICLFLTIGMIMFTLTFNFLVGLDVFGVPGAAGIVPGEGNETFMGFTTSPEYPLGVDPGNLWTLVLTAAGAIGILVAWITRSTVILGVYIFGFVFWAAYINAFSIIALGGWIPEGFLNMVHAGMIFIFVGAIAGMLSGSG